MPVSDTLRDYAERFNSQKTFWYFTKATAVRRESLDTIRRYHSVLMDDVVTRQQIWNSGTQQAYANKVAGRQVTSAWARELRLLFALLGTAWVQANGLVKFTPVGRELLAGANSGNLIANQVRKYQISNPHLAERLTSDIHIIPHAALLDLILSVRPRQITRDEYVFFVSRVRTCEELPLVRKLINEYRRATDANKSRFKSLLETHLISKIGRTFSYAADFLTFPEYLDYSPGLVKVSNAAEAQRMLNWYNSGHDEFIEFETPKDWLSHYGDSESTSSPVAAREYYRVRGYAKKAAQSHVRAAAKGQASPETDEQEFECRVQGEAALEAWLTQNLTRLEAGLTLVGRQYETEDAGRIDVLAKDTQNGYVVIELKRDKASDVAIGQLLRYIGWVRMYLAPGQPPVRGYVVGDRFDDRIVYAILSNDAVEEMCKLKEYRDLQIRLDITRSPEGCAASVSELQP